jgi:alkanesulfonate monooxygenase SsuD/methylene tetrahydromethanopterin reductase-like flavin-dependent oxidoreductase (luciferase family)
MAINRQVVIADTDAEAEAIARAVHPRWAASFVKLWVEHGDTAVSHRVDLDAALRAETILCGSPAHVRDQIARLIAATTVDYVICCFAWGDLSYEQSLRSLRLFEAEVMPAFRR